MNLVYRKKKLFIGLILLLEIFVIYLISNPPLGSKKLEKIADNAAKTGKIGRAVRFYGYALEKDQNNAELYYKRAIEYEKLGMNGNAELDLNEAVAIEPNNSKYRIERLNIKNECGDINFEEIEKILKLSIKTEMDYKKLFQCAKLFQASDYLSAAVSDETENKIEKIEKLNQKIISNYKMQKRNEKLIEEEILEAKFEKYKITLIKVNRGILDINIKNNIVNELYLMSENKYNKNYDVYNKISDVLKYCGEDKRFLQRKIEEDNKYLSGWEKLEESEEDVDKKIDYLTKKISIIKTTKKLDNGKSYFKRAESMNEKREYRMAIKDINEGIKNNPYKKIYKVRAEGYMAEYNYWYAWMDYITDKIL